MRIYRQLDAPNSTPKERLQALKDSKDVLSGNTPGGIMGVFSSTKTTPGHGADAIDGLLRLADYITTGHDYRDNHPSAKHMPSGALIMPTISINLADDATEESVAEAVKKATDAHVSRETSGGDK